MKSCAGRIQLELVAVNEAMLKDEGNSQADSGSGVAARPLPEIWACSR